MKKNNAVALTSRISECAHRFIVKELEKEGICGIVPSHGGILYMLFRGEKYTMKDLADKIHRTKPTVTVLVNKLEEYGYVAREKCTEDNRVTYIALTDKGRELEPIFHEISQRLNDKVYHGLTETEAEQLEGLLEKVNKNLM